MSRACCTACRKPIMIIDSTPVTEIGTTEITQVTKMGCLNKECDNFNVVVDTKYDRIDKQD